MAFQASSIWHLVAGISGATAVGLSAYGAHGFKPKVCFSYTSIHPIAHAHKNAHLTYDLHLMQLFPLQLFSFYVELVWHTGSLLPRSIQAC